MKTKKRPSTIPRRKMNPRKFLRKSLKNQRATLRKKRSKSKKRWTLKRRKRFMAILGPITSGRRMSILRESQFGARRALILSGITKRIRSRLIEVSQLLTSPCCSIEIRFREITQKNKITPIVINF